MQYLWFLYLDGYRWLVARILGLEQCEDVLLLFEIEDPSGKPM